MKTITCSIQGMHCTACAMDIDGTLEDLPGVAEAYTHYAKQATVVTFDEAQIQEDDILSSIQKAGYTVLKSDQ